MTIDQLKGLCDALKSARDQLKQQEARLNACDLRGHQHQITVTVGSLGSVAITETDAHGGYAAGQIRGREMIMLGVKKALSAMVSSQRLRVEKLEQAIADARVSP